MKTDFQLFKTLAKAVAAFAFAGSLMGNQSCSQQPEATVSTRILKKRADLGKITASAMNLPGGGNFDFRFVANAQIYDVLQRSGKFAMTYNQPLDESQIVSLPTGDQAKLSNWGMAQKVTTYAQVSEEAACMINLPQVRIGGTVRSFEATGGGGLSIGFTPAGPIDVSMIPSASVMIQKAQLDLGLVAYSPLTKGLLASADVTAKQTKVDVNLSIDFGSFRLGPKFYFQSPLSKVTKSALEKAITALAETLDKDAWYTRVLADHDSHVAIMGGTNVGLKVGDQLAIYNETHYWEGQPCMSKYLGGTQSSKDPVAVIEISEVGEEISQAKVLAQTDRNPKEGAKVVVFKLIEETPAPATSKVAKK